MCCHVSQACAHLIGVLSCADLVQVLMVDRDRSERQVRKMMDWMHSMKAEVVELKRAQDEEVHDHIHTYIHTYLVLH